MEKIPSHRRLLRWFASSPLLGSAKENAEMLVEEANSGDGPAAEWLGAILENGPTESLLKQIDSHARKVDIPMRVVFERTHASPKRQFQIAHADAPATLNVGVDKLHALAIALVCKDGYLDRIHRCALEDCRKFFVGDPRSRWCSTACGSTARMRAKRQRDRQ